jgi:hypothetical protein
MFEVVIEDQHKRRTNWSPDIGQITLEESSDTFFGVNLSETIESTAVFHSTSLSTTLHHKSSSDGIQGERNSFRHSDDNLSEEESGEFWSFILFSIGSEDQSLTGVVTSEVEGSVDENTYNWNGESSVETDESVSGENFLSAIDHTIKLTFVGSLSDIGGKSGSDEIQRIDEGQTDGTSSSSWQKISQEKFKALGFGINTPEELTLQGVLDGKVYSSCGEISDDVGQITSPECKQAFFFEHSGETIDYTVVFTLHC